MVLDPGCSSSCPLTHLFIQQILSEHPLCAPYFASTRNLAVAEDTLRLLLMELTAGRGIKSKQTRAGPSLGFYLAPGYFTNIQF